MELARSKEKLQRARYLLHDRILERLQHLAVVVIRNTTLLLRQPSFFHGQARATLDLFGQLTPSEKLLAGIDGAAVVQDAQRGHGGADINQRDDEFIVASS